VSDAEFDQALEKVQTQLHRRSGPSRDFLHGSPDSIAYTIGREAIIFLGGGRAAYLQIAHPFVAVGVHHHSDVKNGVQQRFYRTFEYVFGMTFGENTEIFRAARSVRRLHERVFGSFPQTIGPFIKGADYTAHNADAMYWVAATLGDSAVMLYELFVRLLSDDEKTRFLEEGRVFRQLFGIPERCERRTWRDFMVSLPAALLTQFILHCLTVCPYATVALRLTTRKCGVQIY